MYILYLQCKEKNMRKSKFIAIKIMLTCEIFNHFLLIDNMLQNNNN